jgi:hypothetical protein
LIERDESPKCPVCQARFRGSGTCSRCGADLESLMLLIAKAYQLREDARMTLQTGDYERAHRLASEAQVTCSTQKGDDLRLLSSWLLGIVGSTSGSASAGASSGPRPLMPDSALPSRRI